MLFEILIRVEPRTGSSITTLQAAFGKYLAVVPPPAPDPMMQTSYTFLRGFNCSIVFSDADDLRAQEVRRPMGNEPIYLLATPARDIFLLTPETFTRSQGADESKPEESGQNERPDA